MLGHLGDNRVARWLAPARHGLMAWIEAPVLVVLAVTVGLLVRPDDPLLFTGSLRWTLLIPIVVALRYGSLLGSAAMLTLLLAWFLFRAAGLYPGLAFPEYTYLGGLVIVLVAGEFADMWRVRLQRAESRAAYVEERLISLTQRHVVLRLSHDRLEENLLMRPYTVRDALFRLRDVMTQEDQDPELPAGEDVLNLLAEYCQLQRAALYRCHKGALDPSPVATLGENQPLNQDDALLKFALENHAMSHVQMRDTDTAYTGFYWVCAPVMNSADQLIGLLVVERMPFLSINQENLQLCNVLLKFYADTVRHGPQVNDLCKVWPNMPPEFGGELIALNGLAKERKVDTTLVRLSADRSMQARQIVETLQRGRRNLDSYWWVDRGHADVVLLMPMTGDSGFESYMRRTEKMLQDDYAFSDLQQAGLTYSHCRLDGGPPLDQIAELLGVDHVR
ncbi:MAG TPA: PelD GGDEF domain-containing protein [Alcanivorax sp.]|nr:PelD GGDEF domain-containing protein [Alcanivorax sp.]